MNDELKAKIKAERKAQRRLTQKQEAFCQNFVKLMPTYKAYLLAYECSTQTARDRAYDLLKMEHVLERINQLQREIGARHQVTLDEIVASFRLIRARAMDDGNLQAANAANGALAKLIGHDLAGDRPVAASYEHPLLRTLDDKERVSRLLGTKLTGEIEYDEQH